MLGNLPQSHVFNTLNTNTHANVVKQRNFILCIANILENKVILAEQTSMEYHNKPYFGCLCLCGGAFNRNLYFRVQTGTTTNLFNRGFSCLCLWGGAFSRNLYFHVQTGTTSNLFLFVDVYRVVLLVAYCTSIYKQAPQQSDFSCLCLQGGAFSRKLYFRVQTGTKTNLF